MNRQEITLDAVLAEEGTALPLWKRSLDLLLILSVAPALLAIGIVVSLVIKLGSRGPIFFKQSRVGHKGREFMLYKFRTMQENAETDTHRLYAQKLMNAETPMTKLDAKKDPRVIPLGGLLRATGMDELPQLLNVLRGEMSIVGPRPCLPYEYELYDAWQRRRFEAVPGLTGLWQVSGKNRTTFNQMIRLDIEYSEKRNLWLDLSIIARTIPALCQQCQDLRAHNSSNSAQAQPIHESVTKYEN